MADDFPRIGLYALLPGAHCAFVVPSLPSAPEPILSVEDVLLRQRAVDAWAAALALKAVWSLWGQFMWCGYAGVMPDSATQSEIADRFPEFATLGPILEALAPSNTTRGREKQERDLADRRAEIRRGRTRRMSRQQKRQYRGRTLEELVAAFQKATRIHIRSLCSLGVSLPEFERPVDEILLDASIPMAITLNTTGDVAPIDFGRESVRLTNRGFRRVCSAVSVLVEMLESVPTVVLQESSGVNSGRTDPDRQLDAEVEDEVISTGAKVFDPRSLPYLGIRLDVASGELTRDGFDIEHFLTPSHTRILRILIRAAGRVASFEHLRFAWLDRMSDVSNDNIHSEIRKLKKLARKFGLEIKNKRSEGYRLIETKP